MEQTATDNGVQSIPPPPLHEDATLAAVAHDARNMVAALGLYCDLLEAPGVFAEPYQHYGSELKTVANASRGLVDKLLVLSGSRRGQNHPSPDVAVIEKPLVWPNAAEQRSRTSQYWNEIPSRLIDNLAWELETNRNLLIALAGPSITLTVDAIGGALPVRISGEDFTRILVNLVKNAVEAMPGSGGRIQLILRECQAGPEGEMRLLLNIEDNGTGIAAEDLEAIFEPGYSTRSSRECEGQTSPVQHRGLGLSISRSILESAGGGIRAANRDPHGACFQIELPVRTA